MVTIGNSPCCWCSSSTAFVVRTPVVDHHSSIKRHLNSIQRREQCRSSSIFVNTRCCIQSRLASKENGDNNSIDEDKHEDTINADDADSTLPIDLFSGDISEKKVPSLTSQVTLGLFKFFSYCVQFLGLFFFCGLLLNFAGYGYTFDLEHGLVVDKIQNIRNEIQFEREIEREEMEDLRGGMNTGGSNTLSITPEKNVV